MTRSEARTTSAVARRLRQSLERVPIAVLDHFLVYNPHSPSGLVWQEQAAYCTPVGGVAGSLHPSGYWHVCIAGYLYRCHHIVLLLHDVMPAPNDTEVDHIDRNKSNNSIENLRWTDRSGNCSNKKAVGASPYKYASRFKDRWMAKWRMPRQGKYMFSGYYATDYEAHCAAVAHKNAVMNLSISPQLRQ